MNSLKIISATIAATAIGVTLGLIFAPTRGAKLRHKILKRRHKYADHLSNSFDDFLDTAYHSLESVETKSSHLAKKGKEQAQKVAVNLNPNKS